MRLLCVCVIHMRFGGGCGWKCGIIGSMKNLMFFAFCAAMALSGCVESTAGCDSSRIAITGLEVNRLERPSKENSALWRA